MSSTSPRQGLSKTLRSIKARFIVGFTLVLLAAVFSVSALTANLNGPLGQTAGSFTANVFSLFSGGDKPAKTADKPPVSVGDAGIRPTDQERDDAAAAMALDAPSVVFSNPAAITIPATGTGPGAANPYPSTIVVSGLPGTITNMTVTLTGMSHTFPDDVDVMLVGPGGQSAILMSDQGGGGERGGHGESVRDRGRGAMPHR